MKTLLVFPPGWHPNGPYLALPILKSFLKNERGISADIRDLNIEYFDHIFSKNYIKQCYDKIKAENRMNDILKLVRESTLLIEKAKEISKSQKFFNSNDRKFAVNTIANALYVINEAFEGQDLSFKNIDLYHSRYSSEEVMKSTVDKRHNPYINFYEKGIIQEINLLKYKFVGISISGNSQIIPAITLARLIKKLCPSVTHISLGGNYITRMALRFGETHPFFEFVDSILVYDGEISIGDLIESVKDNKTFENINNLYFVHKTSNLIIKNTIVETDYINIYTPDFDGFPLDKYFVPELILPIYSSRSCFSNCAFCTVPKATSGKYRSFKVDKVFSIMRELKAKYGVSIFCFVDETLNLKNMEKLCQMIINEQEEIYWYGETRFSPNISELLCEKLYKGGCRQIQFGLESYCQRVLDKMKKNVKIEWIEPSIRNLYKAHIPVHLFFFTGFPTETSEEALTTYAFTRRMLAESREEYHVPTSTYGFGQFGLEIGSDVWFNPGDYFVEVKPVSGLQDLKLNVDYTAKVGLTQEQSELLVNKQKGNYPIFSRLAFPLPKEVVLSEKVSVMDAIYKTSSTEDYYKVKYSHNYINSLEHCHIELTEHTYIVEIGNNIIFYNVPNRKTYSAPIAQISMSDMIRNGETISAMKNKWSEEDINSYVSDLVYYGLIKIRESAEPYTDTIDEHRIGIVEDVMWDYDDQFDMYICMNPHSNSLVRLSKVSKTLLSLFADSKHLSEIVLVLQDNNIRISESAIRLLVTKCLKEEILYLIK
ncbi:Fe-S oxidoreductase [Desulfosporosinus acidiphilus SJ4]|uniref:Fe-S oxidoreductase n=1 Tax=Desulfosporosinus acidiphilus (strain DSM 22704 / JCM 16185 / SJ4) TaxID=646529 RepID=I4D3P3_DESAJ|nr:radical SAM protein [Desulfosporosinus acidiphilus]AFM40417.1 Fe-S oxidoreductase [Desulfosporosinus acidiphilus SJ4]